MKKFNFGLRPNPNININEIMYNLQRMIENYDLDNHNRFGKRQNKKINNKI